MIVVLIEILESEETSIRESSVALIFIPDKEGRGVVEEIARDGWDEEVHGSIGGDTDKWATMEVGDIQFDDTAFCNEEGGFDDAVEKKIGVHRNSGTRLFAIRMRMEGGASICVDGSY